MLHGRAFVLLALFTCPLFAQQSSPVSGETIEVSIINVDVIVTDRKGNRVYGLTRDDFAIRENGVPKSITNFAEYAPQTKGADGTVAVDANAAAQEPVAAPAVKRTIVLFIELTPRPSERIREVFSSLRDFVRKAVRPGDSATVVVFAERMTTRQTFTDDTNELAAALTAIEEESIEVALRRGDEVRRGLASDIAMDASLASASKPVGQGLNVGEHERRSEELFELIELRTKAAALTSLMESMSGVDGRKIMVAALDRFGLTLGQPQGSGPISPHPQVEAVRQTVMRSANANGVTLYPIHVPGLEYTNAPDVHDAPGIGTGSSSIAMGRAAENNAILMNQTSSLFQIAEETGGLMAAGPSDIVDLLPHIVDDLESYYSLAYRASGASGARKVRVTTKNGNYEVRSRRAVLEKSDDTQMSDRVVSNVFQQIENSVIPIKADLGQIKKKAKNLRSVPVSVRIPIGALTTNSGNQADSGSFSVFIGSGSEAGVSDVTQRSQSYSIGHDQLDAARQSHFTYDVTVDVDKRASVISVGVRDDVSKEFGMVRIPLPD